MKQITAVLIGAGHRGMDAYAVYALNRPNELKFVAVAETNDERRQEFQQLHNLSDDMCFSDWKEILSKPRLADCALICTQDSMHFEPVIKAFETGYHVLLEKPMATTPQECIKISEAAAKYNRKIAVCHVLRYTNFFETLKRLLDEGRIGRLISIQHNENVGYWHHAHSYVRGNWRNSELATPMILAKSCHDMDIMYWLAGAECVNISSFGSLTYFKTENAPKGAPKRCLDGCPVEESCPFYAPKLYLTSVTGWPTSVISNDTSLEARTEAIRNGPYGRCVFHCDNNVVDHQVVSLEFSNEVTAAFTMCAFTQEISRTIKLMGTKGQIRAVMEKNEIEISDFNSGSVETIKLESSGSGHSGGDYGIIHSFVRLLQEDCQTQALSSAEISVHSHLMAFAAEKARLNKNVINIEEFKRQLKSEF